jgi:hypothetical protein
VKLNMLAKNKRNLIIMALLAAILAAVYSTGKTQMLVDINRGLMMTKHSVCGVSLSTTIEKSEITELIEELHFPIQAPDWQIASSCDWGFFGMLQSRMSTNAGTVFYSSIDNVYWIKSQSMEPSKRTSLASEMLTTLKKQDYQGSRALHFRLTGSVPAVDAIEATHD